MRRQRSPLHSASSQPRPHRRVEDVARPGKLRDGAVCPRCSASVRNGRWTWEPAPAESFERVCPACDRIAARDPAGVLRAGGSFAAAHRDDVVGLLRNTAARERGDHPLKRIMRLEVEDDELVVETTDAALVESLGRALHKAYGGQLEHPATTAERENLVRVRWTRD